MGASVRRLLIALTMAWAACGPTWYGADDTGDCAAGFGGGGCADSGTGGGGGGDAGALEPDAGHGP